MKKTLFSFFAALLASSVLAFHIETDDNGLFFTNPDWMPSSVESKNTPGSLDYEFSGIATTNQAHDAFFSLPGTWLLTETSVTNMYDAFVLHGGIYTNDLRDIVNGIKEFGLIGTNQARRFFAALGERGVITTNGIPNLIRNFDSNVEWITNHQGQVLDYQGHMTLKNSRHLYGSLARKSNVSVTNAAALRAILDGYCQRIYHMNRGTLNSWDTSEYGGLTPLDFSFPADFGDRSTPSTRTIGFTTNMAALAANIGFHKFSIYRPSWPESQICIGSSKLMRPNGELYDPHGLDGLDSWSSSIPLDRMIPLRELARDEIYNSDPLPTSLWLSLWRSIGHGDPYLEGITVPTNNFNYCDAVISTIGTNAWNVDKIIEIPHWLDWTNSWMGAAAQALTFIDRTYDILPVRGPDTLTSWYFHVGRSSEFSISGPLDVTVNGDEGVLDNPITVSSNRWSVGQMSAGEPEVLTTAYSGGQFRDQIASKIRVDRDLNPESYIIQSYSMSGTEMEPYMEGWAPFPGVTNEATIYVAEDSAFNCPAIIWDMGGGYYWPIKRFIQPETFTLPEVKITCSISHKYSFDMANIPKQTHLDVRTTASENEYIDRQDFSVLGAILASGDSGSVYRYNQKTVHDITYRYQITNAVDRFATDMDAEMFTLFEGGVNPLNPISYAPVGPEETKTAGTIERVKLGSSGYNISWRIKFAMNDNNEMEVLKAYQIDGTNVYEFTWNWSASYVGGSFYATPIYSTESPIPSGARGEQRVIGDAKAAVMTDFEFPALKNDL